MTTHTMTFDRLLRVRVSLFLLTLATGIVGCRSSTPCSTIHQVREGLQYRLAHVDDLTPSAEQAARRVVAGGKIYVTGSQPGFASEAIGRAGGLMAIGAPETVVNGDVVLAGYRDTPTEEDCRNLDPWRKLGAYVIAFAPNVTDYAHATITPREADVDRSKNDSGNIDSICNLVSLWAWTGEFTSACTRLGKMPVLYQSYGVPGGRERGAKYASQVFHQDMQIAPVAAGELARQYVKAIDVSLQQIEQEESLNLARAASWVSETSPNRTVFQAEGHIWPAQMENQKFKPAFASVLTVDGVPPAGMLLVLHISYQQPPQTVIDRAMKGEFRLVYTSVRRGKHDDSGQVVYINPHWPMPDNCVEVPGYDITILPASGVIQACIYSSIVKGKRER